MNIFFYLISAGVAKMFENVEWCETYTVPEISYKWVACHHRSLRSGAGLPRTGTVLGHLFPT